MQKRMSKLLNPYVELPILAILGFQDGHLQQQNTSKDARGQRLTAIIQTTPASRQQTSEENDCLIGWRPKPRK